MRICSLLLAILWCTSGGAVSGGAVVSTAPDFLSGGAVVPTAPDYFPGGAVVSTAPTKQHGSIPEGCSCLRSALPLARARTAPDYLNTDTSVQLRQLHPLRENALMLGIGYTDILDTYLSPEKYRGTDLRFMSHTRREKDSTCLVHQLLHEGCIATADNRSGNGGEIGGGYTFAYSLLRKWQMPVGSCHLRLLAGGTAELSVGFLYNTRGSNNPAQARLALQLKPTVAADFDFRLFRRQQRPFTLHYEASAPLCGLMFSPNYGQSYYEIFSRGNYDHNCVPTTIASTPSLRQMLTLDFRALHTTWRIGYLGDWRQASVNNLKQHTYTHALVFGIVRRFRIEKL